MVFDGDTHLYYMKYNTEIQEEFDEIKLGQFLEEIIEGRAQSYGGDSWFQRFRRVRTRICYISFKCKPPECMGWGGGGWVRIGQWFAEGDCRQGPGGTPIYWLYGYVPLERVWFSSHLVWYRV